MTRRTSSKLERIKKKIIYLIRAFRIIWLATKGWTVTWAILLLIQGALPAATVYLTKVLVDSVAAAIGSGLSADSVQPIILPAVCMCAVLLGTQLVGSLIGWVRSAQSELVQDYIKSKIHTKAALVDLEFYEMPEESDRMARANNEASTRSVSLLQNFGGLIQNTVTLVAVSALLIPYSIWLPVVLLISTLPALWVVLRHNSLHHDWWERTTEDRRWANYYDSILTLSFPAAEVRILGLAPKYQEAYRSLRKRLRNSRLRLMRNQNIAQLGAGASALFITIGTLGWMGIRALNGAATLGDLALFYQAFSQGQNLMRTLLSSVGQLYSDALFLEHLFLFLDTKPRIKSNDRPKPAPKNLRYGIDFKGVRFLYPGSDHVALDQFTLHIPAGKTVALVGPNGAGKTTVTKLLCRFYDPVEGSIQLDGIDIRDVDIEELRRTCTILFQHPMRYVATAGENISMGDLKREPTLENIRDAAEGGGARDVVERLPEEYDTLLGKQFRGGVELSGGQWQRLTLARAFFRESPIVVLDEPTSFMDSWAETKWLDRFRQLVQGRTAVIVTHRFTTAMRADIICVMENGGLVETGTHEELLAQGGLYAASWKAQMRAEVEVS